MTSSKDLSQFYRIYTPLPVPLKFCSVYYRLAARAQCVKCGGDLPPIILNTHPVYTESAVLGRIRRNPLPNPEDQKIISSFMVNSCNHGVGCANPENFFTDADGKRQPRIFETFLWHNIQKGPQQCQGKGCPFCEPCKRPVRWLRWAPQYHTRDCSVGRMLRTGPFMVTGMQASQRARSAGRG